MPRNLIRKHARYTERDLYVNGAMVAVGAVVIACIIFGLRSI